MSEVRKKTIAFKIKKSLIDRVTEGSISRENLTKAELQEIVTYCLYVVHGDLKWGENVVRDVLGSDAEEEDQELPLGPIDYKFEKLKKITMKSDGKRGYYHVDTGMGGVVPYQFFLNPPGMSRRIDFEEYPGPGTLREIEYVLNFYKIGVEDALPEVKEEAKEEVKA